MYDQLRTTFVTQWLRRVRQKKVSGAVADLLAERGDLDGLRARADAGDQDATRELSGLLIKQGRREEAERLRRFGLNPDGSIAWA